MARWTTLVLAGALGWPAILNAQPWSTRPGNAGATPARPSEPAITVPAPASAVPTAPAPSGEETAAGAELPPVPPLPPTGPLPSSVSAALPPEAFRVNQRPAADQLPKPRTGSSLPPGAHIPDVSGMPPVKPYPAMPPGTYAPIIPPVCCPPEPPSCTTCNDSGCIVFGELIQIRARQSNPVAILQRLDAAVPQVLTSVVHQYNTDHTGGFRAGGGFLFENGYLFTTTFTQYKDQTSQNDFIVPGLADGSTFNIVYTGPGQGFGSVISNPGETLSASWNLQLRTIDIALGAVFSPADCFDLTISGGARLAWLDQDYNVRLTGIDSVTSENLALDLAGAGPMVVAEARVYMLPWLAGYSRTIGSLLLANREDVSRQTITDGAGTVQAIRTAVYSREEVVPVFEMAVGVEASCFDGRVIVNGGYEFHYWYELGTSFSAQAGSQARDPNHADISLDGFYVRVIGLF